MNNIYSIKLLLSIVALVLFPNLKISAQDTYEDNFNGSNYSNSTGNTTWTTSWVELNDDGTSNNGRIRLNNNQLRFRRINNRSISRAVDLSGYASATLTLDFNRTNGNETIDVDLWNDTAGVWETVATLGGTGSITHTFTTAQISANSAIRFITGSGNWENGETIFIDNVSISATAAGPELSINDVTVNEGDGTATFSVTLSAVATGTFTVDYATADGSANAGTDYTSTTGTLTFAGTAGEVETITVPIIDDGDIEADHTFVVNLSNVSLGTVTIDDGQGQGTIQDNDALVITNGSITTCAGVFLDTGGTGGNYQNNENFTYTICPDTPGASINANFTFFDVEVPGFFIWDFLQVYDGNSTGAPLLGTFFNTNPPGSITATSASGCLTFVFSSDGSVTEGGWEATISCNTTSPQIAINDVTVNEDAGTLDFTVAHTGGTTAGSFTVEYATANGTAVAPGDYTATGAPNPTITFPGTTLSTQTISIPIINDNIAETLETFVVNLSNPSDGSVTITDSQGTGTINANDAISLTINDVSVNENAGTATFTVTSSGGTLPGGYSIDYATANNSATAPADYTAISTTTLSFSGTLGETETITVSIIDDSDIEGTQTYFINLSNSSSALVSIADAQGLGTIIDNDAGISINDVTVNENAGTATFTVTHTGATISGGFTIDYVTADNTATAPSDYTATTIPTPLAFSGTPGTQTITIPIIDNNAVETTNETFFVNLSNSSVGSVVITDAQGIGTITDDDPASIAINDVSVNENAGTATFTVTLTGGDVTGGFTVDFATSDVSTTAGSDYTNTSGTLTFAGTENETETITVPIINDTDVEGTETYLVTLSAISNSLVTFGDNQGQGTIIDDETPFIITDGVTDNTCSGVFVDSGSVTGFYGNNENRTYTICPDTPGTSILLNFTTFSVETGFDSLSIYEGTTTTTLIGVFDSGNPPASILSTDASGCLTFVFTSDGSVTRQGWEASIQCATSTVTVTSITVNENVGTATITVTHTGDNVLGGFTVDYNTEDNTALADSDYTATSGTLTFTGVAGTSQTFTIPIINNVFGEDTENFRVNLSNPSAAFVGVVNGTVTITDDGDPPVSNDIPLTLFDEFNGYYDYAATAGTLRTADENVDPCSITTSSSNTLTTTIPAGSTIERAYLVWGHSHRSADDVVTFEGQQVTADVVNGAFGFYYGMVSDVTSIIQSIPDPSSNVYNFSGLTIDNGLNGDALGYCGGTVVFGGWSLFIFYTNPAFPAVSINMYNGFDGASNTTSSYTLSGFFAIGSTGSKTTVLSWEGDPLRTGNESISVTTGAGTTTLTGDGNNNPPTLNNVFNSTIYDDTVVPIVDDSSLFGFDLDTYDISSLITQGETTATTNIQTGGDFVILNTVLLKVPSNLITGTVFDDVNYPGGAGRNLATSSGVGVEGAVVELYDNLGNLEDSDITDVNGDYNIGGMANGDYTVRVVNSTVQSSRGGGSTCTTCLPVQTYRQSYTASTIAEITSEVGGANPTQTDVAAGILTGAQTTSAVSIANEGVVDFDYGFNFNTIVNTNATGQGSLAQFIENANNLDETGLDIEANGIFNPNAGEDTSIFMIPPTGDALGRTADGNFAGGIFDIDIPNGSDLPIVMGTNTIIDGRTQTAYSGDTNTGTVGSGGTDVGTSANTLPNYNEPEIQIHQNDGDVIRLQGTNAGVRNVAVYADSNAGILVESGSATITENLLGVNANGTNAGAIDYGVEITGGASTTTGNYITSNTIAGVAINGGTSNIVQDNHITANGGGACNDNIALLSGSGITIRRNLISNAAAMGIDGFGISGNVTITENSITGSGQNGGNCSGSIESAGIRLSGNSSSITNNQIFSNGGAGIALTGGNTSGNLISQNSIYANGTISDALGIDIDQATTGNPVGDGITLNDNGDTDNGPNGSLNFPIFESAVVSGNVVQVVGWARPGATIEIFVTDITEGTATAGDNQLGLTQDYGEGQRYLTSIVEGSGTDGDTTTSSYTDVDGNTDTTNRFNITITLPSSPAVGTMITATATVGNSTSEFGNLIMLGAVNVITNRNITYRVNPN